MSILPRERFLIVALGIFLSIFVGSLLIYFIYLTPILDRYGWVIQPKKEVDDLFNRMYVSNVFGYRDIYGRMNRGAKFWYNPRLMVSMQPAGQNTYGAYAQVLSWLPDERVLQVRTFTGFERRLFLNDGASVIYKEMVRRGEDVVSKEGTAFLTILSQTTNIRDWFCPDDIILVNIDDAFEYFVRSDLAVRLPILIVSRICGI